MAARVRSGVPCIKSGKLQMTSNLLKNTLDLLDQTNREDWKRLAEEIGVTVNWITMLIDGKIKEPGVNKVERLYVALSGKRIEL